MLVSLTLNYVEKLTKDDTTSESPLLRHNTLSENIKPRNNFHSDFILFTAPTRSLGQGNIFYTCLSFCSQGGLPQCMLGYPLGPCTNPPAPPGAEHAERYGQRAGGTHPTGM